MRHLLLLTVLATLTLVSTGARAAPSADAEVSCGEVALRTRSGAEDGYRILLGSVAIPENRQLARSSSRRRGGSWPYVRNAGFAVRGGTAGVSVSVPEGWEDRVAVSWGERPASSSVRFARCAGSPARMWNVYAGGFRLRSPGECIPLLVRVGGVSTTVRLGVGRACGS